MDELLYMDFTQCPRLLFGCWLHGRVCHRDSKLLKTIGHSHTNSLKRIGEASFLERGVAAKAPYIKKAGSITLTHSFVFDMTIVGWVNGGGEGRKDETDTLVISHEGAARIFAMAEDGI